MPLHLALYIQAVVPQNIVIIYGGLFQGKMYFTKFT